MSDPEMPAPPRLIEMRTGLRAPGSPPAIPDWVVLLAVVGGATVVAVAIYLHVVLIRWVCQ